MLFKVISALAALGALGLMGWVALFDSTNPMPLLLIAIGLFLFAIWVGVWYISEQIESQQ